MRREELQRVPQRFIPSAVVRRILRALSPVGQGWLADAALLVEATDRDRFRIRSVGSFPGFDVPRLYSGWREESTVMSVVISDEILGASRLSASELKVEIAVMLFEKEKLSRARQSTGGHGAPRVSAPSSEPEYLGSLRCRRLRT